MKAYKIDGHDDAIIGVWESAEGSRLVYDHSRMVMTLMQRDDLSYDEAVDYISFNILAAHFDGCPIVIFDYDPDSYDWANE